MAKFDCPTAAKFCTNNSNSRVGGTEKWEWTGSSKEGTRKKTKVVDGGTKIYHRTAVFTNESADGNIVSTKKVLYIETEDAAGNAVWRAAAEQNIVDGEVQKTASGSNWSFDGYSKDGKPNETQAGADLQKSLITEGSAINRQENTNTSLGMSNYRDDKGERLTMDQKKEINPRDAVTLTAQQEHESTKEDLEKQQATAEKKATAADAEAEAQSEMNVGEDKERTDYGGKIIRYPITLDGDTQDFMLFDMLKYQPRNYDTGADSVSGIKSRANMGLQSGRAFKGATPAGTQDGERKIIATIGLPIPAGISDSNGVDWGQGQSDAITTALAGLFGDFIPKGNVNTEAAEGATSQGTQMSIQNAVMNNALSGADFSKRKWGMAANTNMELLFNGPKLRSFTFTFRLSARSNDEAMAIKKIIRTFKQGMSPKKSKSFTFVKAPHTFMIGYYHKTNTHEWLNTFKETALTNLSLTDTPDGQYSTYTDGPMTSYQMQLQFQELEPVFDGDYNDLDGNADTHIGY